MPRGLALLCAGTGTGAGRRGAEPCASPAPVCLAPRPSGASAHGGSDLGKVSVITAFIAHVSRMKQETLNLREKESQNHPLNLKP